jgi:hypothetical protein
LAGRQYTRIKLIILGVLVTVFFAVVYIMQHTPLNITGSINAPRLELLSSTGYHSITGEMVVEGKVRNIGGDILRDVQAVVSWYDKDGNKLANANSNLYLSPVLSFQVSPFRVALPYNSQMERYDISFTTPTGETIYTRDRRKIKAAEG